MGRIEADGVVGWGESVAPETPWDSGETAETVWWLLDEIAIPRLLATDIDGPSDTSRILGWIKDHRMAKATLEMSIWDLFAKAANVPLSKLLGGTRDRILCGVAIGIQPTVEALLDKIAMELEGGYQRVKVKIKPGWDGHVAEAIRNRFPELPFQLDANSAYTLANFRLPGDVSASKRYFATEIIGEPFTVEKDGTMKVPTGPGIGVTVLENEIRKMALKTKEYRPA